MKRIVLTFGIATLMVSCGADTESNEGEKSTQKKTTEQNDVSAAPDQEIKAEVKTDQDQQANADAPAEVTTIKFERVEHDFGMIPKDDKVETTFKFTNTGDQPYVISSARGSCGCTVPSYPKTPIAPGETSEIDVVFDSKGKKGDITKTVTLIGNTDPNVTKLTIKGKIEE